MDYMTTQEASEKWNISDHCDIERILFRCGLLTYDSLKIALITKGIHSKDLLWIADHVEDCFRDAVTDMFESVIIRKTDLQVICD